MLTDSLKKLQVVCFFGRLFGLIFVQTINRFSKQSKLQTTLNFRDEHNGWPADMSYYHNFFHASTELVQWFLAAFVEWLWGNPFEFLFS